MASKVAGKASLLIGVLFIILGLYGAIRTTMNFVVFENYPTRGVYNFGFFTSYPYYEQRETDCLYPMIYYKTDGVTVREATAEEKERDAQSQQSCLQGIKDNRAASELDDVSHSILFLLLGFGALWVSRKVFE